MSRAFDVVCVGAATLDTIAVLDRPPGADERVRADPFVVAGGGPAATAAVTLARLGVAVAFCGVVGRDEAGAEVRAGLDAEGVDTRWLSERPGAVTSRSFVMVERHGGARSIVATASPALDVTDIPLGASDWIHVDQHGYAPARRAITAASGAAPQLSVDAGNAVPGLELAGVGLYAPTLAALGQRYPGAPLADAFAAAAAEGARRVVATAGAEGSYVLADGIVHVPAAPVEVVSTLGAGDVYHGALLAGLVRGRDLVTAAEEAALVAALSCRGLDGRSAVPHRAETEQELERRRAVRADAEGEMAR